MIFAYTGLRTEIGQLTDYSQWLWCLGIMAVACLSKTGGAAIATRCSGFSTRESLGIGVLMNTRGLMELVVLNVGLDLGIISPALFTIMVIMALVATIIATPLFIWVTK